MRRKILNTLMVVCAITSLTACSFNEEKQVAKEEASTVKEVDVKYEGVSGKLEWKLYENGLLTIKGDGDYELITDESGVESTPWFEYADKHNLIALIHADSPEYAEAVDVLSVRYPNITFILAHSGASYAIARKNSEVAKKHDNVVLDITYTSTARGMVEFLVNEVGADKVLFATDMPMRDPAPQLGWVCYADIPLEDKKKILAENIISIMKRRK